MTDEDAPTYYDPDRVGGFRLWFWERSIAAIDWVQLQTYGRVRGFLWGRWHRAYKDYRG